MNVSQIAFFILLHCVITVNNDGLGLKKFAHPTAFSLNIFLLASSFGKPSAHLCYFVTCAFFTSFLSNFKCP